MSFYFHQAAGFADELVKLSSEDPLAGMDFTPPAAPAMKPQVPKALTPGLAPAQPKLPQQTSTGYQPGQKSIIPGEDTEGKGIDELLKTKKNPAFRRKPMVMR